MKTLHYYALALALIALTVSAQARTWTAKTGETLDGEFVKLEGDTVFIQLPDGKNKSIDLALLSDEDQQFVRNKTKEKNNSPFKDVDDPPEPTKETDAQKVFLLGMRHLQGEDVPQNLEEAAKYFRQSAELGFAPAQCLLGVCYVNGEGVPQNSEEGVKWLRQSAEQGFEPAMEILREMEGNKEVRVPTDSSAIELKGHTEDVWSAVFSPDGKKIVTTSSDETIRIWDAESGSATFGKEIRKMPGGSVREVLFSTDSKKFFTEELDMQGEEEISIVQIWDAETGKEWRKQVLGVAVEVSENRKKVIALNSTNRNNQNQGLRENVQVWDVDTGRLLTLKPRGGPIPGVNWAIPGWFPGFQTAVSPDGTKIISVRHDVRSETSNVQVWDANTGRELRTLGGVSIIGRLRQQPEVVETVIFSRDSSLVALHGSYVGIWDVASGRELHKLYGYTGDFSPDGTKFATVGLDDAEKNYTVHLWDVKTGKKIATLGIEGELVEKVLFSPDSKKIVAQCFGDDGENTTRVFDADSGKKLFDLDDHPTCFSPDSKTLIVEEIFADINGETHFLGSEESGVRIVDAESGKVLHRLQGRFGEWSPDGKKIIVIFGNTVRVEDLSAPGVAQAPKKPEEEEETILGRTRKAAEQGDAQAQYNLGCYYYQGTGAARDYEEAATWFRKAAEQEYAQAQFNLGVCYKDGTGVAQDFGQAAEWFLKAAEQGHVSAQSILGAYYIEGIGVEKNEEEAVKWTRKAAERGDAQAQHNLGWCYYQGIGVAENDEEAVNWYRKAAEQGYADAQSKLGRCYSQGIGVAENDKEAFQWFLKAAEQGNMYAQYDLGLCYLQGTSVEKDAEKAAEWFRQSAEQGYAQAQYNLGVCYNQGVGVTQDGKEAFKWYRQAAEQGHMRAQYNLGVCYEQGTGIDKDVEKAKEWYQKAADQGHEVAIEWQQQNEVAQIRQAAEQGDAEAQYTLGGYYFLGTHVEQSDEEAVKWNRQAAEQGHAQAQFNLGVFYQEGTGVEQNYEESFKWYRQAAEQEYTDAQYVLGMFYYLGTGIEQNYEEAVKWFRQAAEQGDADAQCSLGYCYAKGEGVPQNYEEAVKWWRKAAEQGNAIAQSNLGCCYYEGTGVAKDYDEAIAWFRKSIEQGYAGAQSNLAECYRDGNGVPQDYEKAMEWYRQAAEQDYAEAQYNLGVFYRDGNGVPQDKEKAMEWFRKAAEQEFEDAIEALRQLEGKADDEEKKSVNPFKDVDTKEPIPTPQPVGGNIDAALVGFWVEKPTYPITDKTTYIEFKSDGTFTYHLYFTNFQYGSFNELTKTGNYRVSDGKIHCTKVLETHRGTPGRGTYYENKQMPDCVWAYRFDTRPYNISPPLDTLEFADLLWLDINITSGNPDSNFDGYDKFSKPLKK